MCGGNKDCGCNKPKPSGCGCKKEEPKKYHHAHIHHSHGHGHGCGHGCKHVVCGCNQIYDANSLCKSNVSCYINSNRTYSTKVMYIKRYHLDLESEH